MCRDSIQPFVLVVFQKKTLLLRTVEVTLPLSLPLSSEFLLQYDVYFVTNSLSGL